jgi:hypothetical protein
LDLITTPKILPITPPKYTVNSPLTHKGYAHFSWRKFLYYNYPTQKNTHNLPGISPFIQTVIYSNSYDQIW